MAKSPKKQREAERVLWRERLKLFVGYPALIILNGLFWFGLLDGGWPPMPWN